MQISRLGARGKRLGVSQPTPSPIAPRLLPIACREAYHRPMKVQLSHPERQVEAKGPKRVRELLRDLNLIQEAYLVIRGDDLVTEDELLKDEDEVEVRPVISGG